MATAEHLAACARQLFEGVSGSAEQHAANAWLMQFQSQPEAWDAALQLLQQLPRDPTTELVAMQILRLKTQQQWGILSAPQRQLVRQTLLKLLQDTCVSDAGLSPVSSRIACVTVADIVVKSYKEWPDWKSDVQRLVDAGVAANRPHRGAAVLAEILGAIPVQILGLGKLWGDGERLEVLAMFQKESKEVLKAVQMILSSIPEERNNALRCLENWIVGCVSSHETFGLTAAHIFISGLVDVLFKIVVSENEEQSQLAAGIIADSFVNTVSTPTSEAMVNAVLHTGRCLVGTSAFLRSKLQAPNGAIIDPEHQITACKGISRIACSLAMNHAPSLFSGEKCNTLPAQQKFTLDFLELLLACSAHKDVDVVQPTLEIWFFFLEETSSQNEISLEVLGAVNQKRIVSILSRLVNALIEHCKYPQWFIERQEIYSDDPDVEAVTSLRREIADTLLSLFSKWPGNPSGDYVSCVKGMSEILSESSDVALLDALLFLLSYLVELFDVVSSDSESEEGQNFCEPTSDGVDVLLGILDCAGKLPVHPLVVGSFASYLRSLSASLALPANAYLRASSTICQGLQFSSSFPVAVQSLLQSSSSISKYTSVEERAPLLQTLLAFCNDHPANIAQENQGDLLEVTFRIASGASDAEFATLCSSVLSNLTIQVQSESAGESSSAIYLLGRALSGVQDLRHGHALVDQLWSLVSSSLLRHKADEACRRSGVHFFLTVLPLLDEKTAGTIEPQILGTCLWWYDESIAPDTLACCSRIFVNHGGDASFQTTASQVFQRLLAAFRAKLHDTPEAGEMEEFLTQDRHANLMIPEVEQFMKLTREMLTSCPQVLVQDHLGGGPNLYWTCLDLATRILEVDHQMQEMCDAACDFLLDALRCQPDPILAKIDVFATKIMRVVLDFLGPKREQYRVRNIWDFLFQCLHAPQMPVQIRAGFQSAVSVVVLEQNALHLVLPPEVCQQLPNELRTRRQRHRFRQYFAQLAQAGAA